MHHFAVDIGEAVVPARLDKKDNSVSHAHTMTSTNRRSLSPRQTDAVIGASDKFGGKVADRPVSVADFAATVYHVLGLDPKAEKNVDDRIVKVLPEGRVVHELF